MEAGIRILNEAHIPTFATPEEAVDTFMHMYSYSRNLELLQETPPSLPHEIQVNRGQAQDLHRPVSQATRENPYGN